MSPFCLALGTVRHELSHQLVNRVPPCPPPKVQTVPNWDSEP